MNKYKKIFSGLGLLSISTLIGASVVACANKKPKPSDSSTEGIDQNNNQGNSTTPEQGKPEMPQNPAPGTDHNNQEKNEDSTGKDNNGKTELEKDKKPEKTPEQGQNDKQKENKDESDKSDSNQIKKENEGKNTTPKDGKEQMPPKVMTVDEKVQELNSLVEKFPYPETEDKAETETKTFLKSKVELIKNKPNQSEEQKIIELNELETIFKEYEGKINKYKAIINNDKFKSNKYNPNGLNGRLAKLFGEDPEGKYTESELIWQIYETFRRSAFVKSKNFTPKIYEYVIVDDSEKNKHSTMFEALADDKKKNHNIDITQLEQKINNIVNFTIEIAKKAANKNIDKIKYTNTASDTEKPDMLIEKLKSFVTTTTNLSDIDTLIGKIKQIVSNVQEIVKSVNNKDKNIKDKINKIAAKNIDEVITELGKLKPTSSAQSNAN